LLHVFCENSPLSSAVLLPKCCCPVWRLK
jgi:hypothetical protein